MSDRRVPHAHHTTYEEIGEHILSVGQVHHRLQTTAVRATVRLRPFAWTVDETDTALVLGWSGVISD